MGTQSESKAQQRAAGGMCVLCACPLCVRHSHAHCRGPSGLGTSSPLGKTCFGVRFSSASSRSLTCLMLVAVGDKILGSVG